MVLAHDDEEKIVLKHQHSMGDGIPSKSKKHSERIIEKFTEHLSENFLLKINQLFKLIGKKFNNRIEKVYSRYFYPNENFSYKFSLVFKDIFDIRK